MTAAGIVHHGDCREVMRALAPDSIDALVSDPPYGLAFMGKAWDHGVPGVEFWTEALRVLKPGAHLVAFGGTRTYHRLTCAIEDAGFEIRDCLSWLYGSGFPKSLDVGKALDKHGGTPPAWFGPWLRKWREEAGLTQKDITAPASEAARQWDGWGTALKPAWEPIILARKPLIGTVAANVAAHGTGGLNVDGCRIEYDTQDDDTRRKPVPTKGWCIGSPTSGSMNDSALQGRWPANVCVDEDAAGMFPESRFFYTAKASRREREAGLEGMEERTKRILNGGIPSAVNSDPVGMSGGGDRQARNHHPTVKPIALMRWLCRLVTPPGGLVLDPFTGSGSTGCAAVLEGFRFVGAELEAEYVEIARARIAHWERTVAPKDRGPKFDLDLFDEINAA